LHAREPSSKDNFRVRKTAFFSLLFKSLDPLIFEVLSSKRSLFLIQVPVLVLIIIHKSSCRMSSCPGGHSHAHGYSTSRSHSLRSSSAYVSPLKRPHESPISAHNSALHRVPLDATHGNDPWKPFPWMRPMETLPGNLGSDS
jgi:hypothetical protein